MGKLIKTLFKLDSGGRMRVWRVYVDEVGGYYTESGLHVGGKLTKSKPTICEAKNVGKINETSVEEQAILEAESSVRRKIDREGHHESEMDAVLKMKFSPTLAKTYQDRQEVGKLNFPYLCSPKLDGIRSYSSESGEESMSRKNKLFVSCPHLQEEIIELCGLIYDTMDDGSAQFMFTEVKVDGEFYNHELRSDFEQIVSLVKQSKPTEEDFIKSEKLVQYHVFDFCCLARNEMFSDRYKILCDIFDNQNFKYLKLVEQEVVYSEEEAFQCKEKFKALGYEGAMLKNPDSNYEMKRTENILKYKDFIDEEFDAIDILEGKGNWANAAKSILCVTKEGIEFKAGIKGTLEAGRELLKNKDFYIGKKQATIKFQEYTTKNNVPRFGVLVAFRDYE